ncbi:hypothetical protein BFJ66_g8551 [Fusarium oxysporum f. sp. cepae]|uniref:Uncharacterized protein n=1 Tax=Fusarium oxysporum f. sp. cepae TaxID=396571 RepID=A0A3L6NJJ7_FUSOX|nr:hypothetical protein BFJ65_g8717 [Fusarium oxysporum f. sp. cepae]RKK46457.1 hypothetical protein BFJ66_g8551 [Fusarium oxysporum f. sp. cepae]RKK49038.1 hypothetical protein BFJ67_g7090 [Fusarium oxysporum f. sp. cepae]
MSLPSPDQQDTESVSSVDSFDPDPTLALKKTTREEVRKGVTLFADFHDEKMKAMEREAHDLVQQERDSMDVERSAFLTAFELQNEAIAD